MSIAAVRIRVNLCLFHSLRYSLVHSLVEFDSSVLFYATAFGLDSLESLTLSFPFCAFRACFMSLCFEPVPLRGFVHVYLRVRGSVPHRLCSLQPVGLLCLFLLKKVLVYFIMNVFLF